MTKSTLLELLAAVESGSLTPQSAADRLADPADEDRFVSRSDLYLASRTGLPEVIYAQDKSPAHTS